MYLQKWLLAAIVVVVIALVVVAAVFVSTQARYNNELREAVADGMQFVPTDCRTENEEIVRAVVGLGDISGLGVVIGDYVVTAKHVVGGLDTINVFGWTSNYKYETSRFSVVYRSTDFDYAILEPVDGGIVPFIQDAREFLYRGDLLQERAGGAICHFRVLIRNDGKYDFPAIGGGSLMSIQDFAQLYERYVASVVPDLEEAGEDAKASWLAEVSKNLSSGESNSLGVGATFLSSLSGPGASGGPVFVRDPGDDNLKVAGIVSAMFKFDALDDVEIKAITFVTLEQICEDSSNAGVDLCLEPATSD